MTINELITNLSEAAKDFPNQGETELHSIQIKRGSNSMAFSTKLHNIKIRVDECGAGQFKYNALKIIVSD